MNTIYDNTFVLGETSATNFIAGNGITIDSPSAGTVRIGADETVLFENSAGASVINGIPCSENPFNFDELKIYWYCESDTNRKIDFISPAYLGLNDKFNLSYSMPADNFENMNYMYLRNCTMTLNTSGISLRNAQQAVLYNKTVTLGPEASTFAAANIVKVIGINRISGSNA